MVAFDSPVGETLRRMRVSRAALAAIWFDALNADQDAWADWARGELDRRFAGAPVVLALHFLQACKAGDPKRARQLWGVLGSVPLDGAECRILNTAVEMGRRLVMAG